MNGDTVINIEEYTYPEEYADCWYDSYRAMHGEHGYISLIKLGKIRSLIFSGEKTAVPMFADMLLDDLQEVPMEIACNNINAVVKLAKEHNSRE